MTPSERGRANTTAGGEYQRVVAGMIARALRVPLAHVFSARSGVPGACDVQMSTEVYPLFPFWVEAKDRRKLSLREWLRQARRDAAAAARQLPLPGLAPSTPTPVVVFRDGGRDYAVVPLPTFLALAARDRVPEPER